MQQLGNRMPAIVVALVSFCWRVSCAASDINPNSFTIEFNAPSASLLQGGVVVKEVAITRENVFANKGTVSARFTVVNNSSKELVLSGQRSSLLEPFDVFYAHATFLIRERPGDKWTTGAPDAAKKKELIDNPLDLKDASAVVPVGQTYSFYVDLTGWQDWFAKVDSIKVSFGTQFETFELNPKEFP